MRKPPLGLREYVALAILLAAVALALYLFNDGGGSGSSVFGDFDAPHRPLIAEGDWTITYFAIGADDIEVGKSSAKSLDLDFAQPPDAALQSGRWGVRAEMRLSGPPGAYQARVRSNGAAVVFLDGKIAVQTTPTHPHELVFPINVTAAGPTVRVEVRDTGGPVSLHWSLLPPLN